MLVEDLPRCPSERVQKADAGATLLCAKDQACFLSEALWGHPVELLAQLVDRALAAQRVNYS